MKKWLCMFLSLMILVGAGIAFADPVGSEFHDGLAYFQRGDLFGYIDTRGNIVIEPAFHQAANFENGYAKVNVGAVKGVTTYQYIDTTGKVVAKPSGPSGQNYFDLVEWFGDIGIQEKWSKKEDKYKNFALGFQYVNEKGKPVDKTVFTFAGDFDEEGFAIVGTGKLNAKATRSTMSISQNSINKCHFLAYAKGNGFTQVSDTYYYINRKGKQLGKLKFSIPPHGFSEGLAAVPGKPNAKGDSTWGYIDPQGKMVIAEQFSSAGDFKNGVAIVSVGSKYGMINKNGEFVIEAKWDGLGSFSEGLAYAKKGDLYTYIDETGKPIGEVRWANVRNFSEGLAGVKEPGEYGKYGFINTAGEVVVEPVYDNVYAFQDGYALVKDGVAWGAIRTDGSMAVPLAYEKLSYLGKGVFSAQEFNAPMIYDENHNMVTVVLINGSVPEEHIEDGTEVQLIAVPEMENGLSFSVFVDKETKGIRSMNMFGDIKGETFHIETGSGKKVVLTEQGMVDGYWDDVSASDDGGHIYIRVQRDGRYGYYREDGTALTAVEYEKAGNYRDGAAIVWKGQKWYIIDTNGNVVF